MAMRRRRFTKGRKAFSFRKNPTRTHVVKEPRWSFSNFRIGRQFQPAPQTADQSQFVVMNPRLMFENLDPLGPGAEAQVQNAIAAPSGVKVGGIEWDSSFHFLQPVGSPTLIAYCECKENLIVQEVQDDGLPNDLPDWMVTWRPMSVAPAVDTPKDGSFDVVRILRRRTTFIPYGQNAMSSVDEGSDLFHFNPNAQTASHQGWGHQSKRLKSFITDDQQLVFDVSVFRPDSGVVQPPIISWLAVGTLYWKLGR